MIGTKKLASLLFAGLFVFFAAVSGFSLEVSRSELDSVSGQGIVFINYTGPQTVINTLPEIRGIGTNLGTIVSAGGSTAGYTDRYMIIHAVDETVPQGLDADILILGPSAGVDHIDNLRLIISSYLEAAYGYTEADASTLAVFITVYNAVYRGQMTPFQQKYKQIVVSNLNPDICGLSVNYADWPGKSQIVIPLSAQGGPGTLSAIDTTVISDKNVVDSMREGDGMGIDDRKDLVDIKEREAQQAEQRAQDIQKEATQAQQQAADERAKQAQEEAALRQAQQEAEQARREAERAQQQAAAAPDDAEAQRQAEQAQQQAEQKRAEAEQQAQKTEQQQQTAQTAQQAADEKTQQAAGEQAFADRKQTEAQSDRTEIAKDNQKIIEQENRERTEAQQQIQTVTAVKVIDNRNLLSAPVLLNSSTGSVVRESPVNSIRGRTLLPAGDGFIAVAGKNTGTGAIKLVLLDGETLDITVQSAENVAENAVLVMADGFYYTVIQSGTGYVIGKYDETLSLKNKSAVEVLPETAITVSGTNLTVQTPGNTFRILRTGDLVDITK